MHSRYVRYAYQLSGAGPYLSIWLAAPRGAADVYVSFMFCSYLTITGNAPSGQSHLCHPFIYGSPASPLLSRTPITKYISGLNSSSTPRVFYKCSYNHARRLRLEKLL
jgi:hypothetical protein